MPETHLDSAGAYSLAELVSLQFQFGRDVIYSFGPYSTLYSTLYHPFTDFTSLWNGLLLTFTYTFAADATFNRNSLSGF
jgi:hypothetical protein